MKIIRNILFIILLGLSLNAYMPAFAAEGDVKSTLNGLDGAAKKVGAYQSQVAQGDPREVVLAKVGGLVGLILSFVGIIFLLLIVYAGFQWMTAQGNSGQVDKAKDLMINAVIGLIIVTAAYSITYFVGDEIFK